MTKTPTRFSVRKVKCCYRNAMIAGNPIEKTFERFAVYDKNWKTFGYVCGLNYDDCKYLMNPHNGAKYRRLFDDEASANKAAIEMNRLWNACGRPEMIKFSDWGEVKVEKTEAKYPWNQLKKY